MELVAVPLEAVGDRVRVQLEYCADRHFGVRQVARSRFVATVGTFDLGMGERHEKIHSSDSVVCRLRGWPIYSLYVVWHVV